jgi:hypothetical protein
MVETNDQVTQKEKQARKRSVTELKIKQEKTPKRK